MNLFRVHEDPRRAAVDLADSHVVKMATEGVQILCAALARHGEEVPWGVTHPRHPCVLWAGRSYGAGLWVFEHTEELCFEYTRRFGREHGALAALERVRRVLAVLPDRPADMPPVCVNPAAPAVLEGDPVMCYRWGMKRKYASWHALGRPARYTRAQVPGWLGEVADLVTRVE